MLSASISFLMSGGTKNENGSDTTKPASHDGSHAAAKPAFRPTLSAVIASYIHIDISADIHAPKNSI